MKSAALVSGLLLLTSLARADLPELELPPEVFTLARLTSEMRSTIRTKLREMQQTYSVREGAPGELFFEDSQVRATERLIQRLSVDKSLRQEEVRFTDPEGRALFEELITTTGKDLKLSDARKRLFFTSDSDYALEDGETIKDVILKVEGLESFRFTSRRVVKSDGAKDVDGLEVQTVVVGEEDEFIFGGTKVLELTDQRKLVTRRRDGNPPQTDRIRTVAYRQTADQFAIQGKIGMYRYIGSGDDRFSVRVYQRAFDKIDGVSWLRNDAPASANDFLTVFNKRIYSKLFLTGLNSYFISLTTNFFPQTTRRQDLTGADTFRKDLEALRAQLTQAQTNPAAIATIIIPRLNGIINAIADGQIEVKDHRDPKGK